MDIFNKYGNANGNPHNSHRIRFRARVAEVGFANLSEVDKVEFLLFYCIPMKDVRPLAERLLEKFGTLKGILDANYEELIGIPGVNKQTALFLCTLKQVCEKILASGTQPVHSSFYNYVTDAIRYAKPNSMHLYCLNSTYDIINVFEYDDFNITTNNYTSSKDLEQLKNMGTKYIAVVIKVQRLFSFPAQQEVKYTAKLYNTAKSKNMGLIDVIVVLDNEYISLRPTLRNNK